MKHLKERLKKFTQDYGSIFQSFDFWLILCIFGEFFCEVGTSSWVIFLGFFLILVSSILLVFYLIREARSPETPKWSKLLTPLAICVVIASILRGAYLLAGVL